MFVHGPGGIGKTTLLDAMARATRTGGRQVTYLDGRDVECSPAAVLAAVRARTVDDPAAVLLVDGYELLTPLDRWFRTEFLPARPADAVTVVAGREAPAAAWWLDPGWRRLVSVHGLDELDAADSRDLLLGLGVTDQVDRLARARPRLPPRPGDAGRGRPVGSAPGTPVRRPRRRPPAVRADPGRRARRGAPGRTGHLRARHPDHPGPAHPDGRVRALRRSGRGWSRVRTSGRRPSVCTCTTSCGSCSRRSWRTAPRPSTSSCTGPCAATSWSGWSTPREPHPDRAAAEVLLLHRKTPLAAETSLLRDRGQLSVPRAGPVEREEIVALIETHEGSESADLARRWLAAQPRSAYHGRADNGTAAFALQVYLPGPGRPDGRRPDRGGHLEVRVGPRPAASR